METQRKMEWNRMHDKIVNECKKPNKSPSNAEQYIKTASCSAQLFMKRRHVTHSLSRPTATCYYFQINVAQVLFAVAIPIRTYTYIYTQNIVCIFGTHCMRGIEEFKASFQARLQYFAVNFVDARLCGVCVCVSV